MNRCHATLLLPAALLLVACTPPSTQPTDPMNEPKTASADPRSIRWPINNLDSIAGKKPEVLGHPQVVSDPAGKAIHFNGVDDGLIVPAVPIADMKQFTIECLFKPDADGPAESRFIHSQDQAGNRFTLETRVTPQGWALDTFLLSGQDRLTLLDTKKLHPTDRWYWVALRFDGSTMTSFINGEKELEGPVKFAGMNADGQVSIGVRLNKVSWFKGLIKELRVTPTALPDSALQRVP